jgi:hypothetical protein
LSPDVIINLIPEFLDARSSADPLGAYHGYLRRHRPLLEAYWHNYVLDLDTPPAEAAIGAALAADRRDLDRLLATVDLDRLAADALDAAAAVLQPDHEVDVVLMVGVGAANAGELVVNGRPIAFICVEHFTGHANPETFGLGLSPQLIPLWLAHEVAHGVRYCSPTSRADIRRLVAEAGGSYDCWELASRAPLRELLVNEGAAIHASRAAAPGFPEEAYLGVSRRQFRRLREQEAFLSRAVDDDLDRVGLGLRLRWLTGGLSAAARTVREGRTLPERSGYYVGSRLADALVADAGIAAAVRAPAAEFTDALGRGFERAASA